MIRAEVVRYTSRDSTLIVLLTFEARRESLDRAAGVTLHRSHHRTGIYPTRQESTYWHVGHHLTCHRPCEFTLKRFYCGPFIRKRFVSEIHWMEIPCNGRRLVS